MKKSFFYIIALLFTTVVAFAQTKNDTGSSPGAGISTTTLLIGLAVVLLVGYFLVTRSKKK